jgi:hypothetical protein
MKCCHFITATARNMNEATMKKETLITVSLDEGSHMPGDVSSHAMAGEIRVVNL